MHHKAPKVRLTFITNPISKTNQTPTISVVGNNIDLINKIIYSNNIPADNVSVRVDQGDTMKTLSADETTHNKMVTALSECNADPADSDEKTEVLESGSQIGGEKPDQGNHPQYSYKRQKSTKL